MALVLNDRVKETTTTTGTGTINLAGAETGFETFVAGIGNSNTCYYCISHQTANEFEVGLGTITDASPDTLARTTIISSSNSDSAVDFSAGTKDVFCTLPASKTVFLNSSADINLADDTKILLGAGDDLQLYHDGSNSYVVDNGTGGLVLRGTNTVDIQSALGHNYLKSTISAGTQIYYDNSEKFATVSGGVKVTGNIENASGSMTIDVADNIVLDADGGNIALKDAGTQWGNFANNGGNFDIDAVVQDKDIKFNGYDGSSYINALTLDMSEAGAATFNDNVTAYSDERLKDNIETIENGLDKVEQLRGVTYTRDEKENIGVIAQEVEKILPEIVLTADDEMGTKSVDYSRLTAVLIEAVKEQQEQIETLNDYVKLQSASIMDMERRLNELENK